MNTQESAPFIKCPGEVCRLILSSVYKEDLLAICLSHRAVRIFAEPFLYEEVYFEWEEECHHPITSFLRSILRRPRLAAYLRTFELRGRSKFAEALLQAPKILLSKSALEETLLWVARRTNLPYRESWMEELRNGTMEAFVAVLLSQATNLATLSIYPEFIRGGWLVGEVLRSMALHDDDHGLPSQMEQLKEVSLWAKYGCREQSVDQYTNSRHAADLILPFFYLPSLERIQAQIDNPVEFSWPTKHPPRSNVNSLELFHLRETFLGQILSTTQNVQSFRWDWYYDNLFDDGHAFTSVVDLTKLTTALRYVQDTLVNLIIAKDCIVEQRKDFPGVTIQGSLEALSDFRALKSLGFPFVLQLGFSPHEAKRLEACLPIGLETLILTDAFAWVPGWEWKDHDVVKAMEVWLESAQTTTPELHSLTFEFGSQTYFYWTESASKKLMASCERVGIEWNMYRTY